MASSDKVYKIGIIVGENSGDLLAAAFMKAWLNRYPNTSFIGVGGPRMIALGLKSFYPMEDLNVMGLIEPLKRLPRLIQIYRGLKQSLISEKPDCVIGVDYQEFNLAIERALKKQGIKTVHYVGPTLWAWRPNRIFKVKQSADKVLVLFPFEKKIYETHQIDVTCVGHPFADEIPEQVSTMEARRHLGLSLQEPILALLPGSRAQEIKMLAKPFAEAAKLLKQSIPTLNLVCGAVNETKAGLCREIFEQVDVPIAVIVGQTRTVIAASDAVLLSTGTATLETMLLKKPMVAAYRLGRFTYQLAKWLVTIPYIALPNILADQRIIPEFVQNEVTPQNLKNALIPYFDGNKKPTELIDNFHQLHTMLKRNASETAVDAVEALLEKSTH
ncbi:MAG: lipid-A-disaccharide synthase [Gammaproteobacteria bacterium]